MGHRFFPQRRITKYAESALTRVQPQCVVTAIRRCRSYCYSAMRMGKSLKLIDKLYFVL